MKLISVESSDARSAIRDRLESRRPEIEEATVTRVCSISNPRDVADPSYVESLRVAVATAVGHGLSVIDATAGRPPPVPLSLLEQARLASRLGVALDTVLRRYFAGYSILCDYILDEGVGLLDPADLKHLLRAQSTVFDQLVAAVSEEFRRETKARVSSGDERRVQGIRNLLAGKLVDSWDIGYRFECHHLGLVVAGRFPRHLKRLAATLDRRLLLVRPDEQTTWAWLGGQEPLDPSEVLAYLEAEPVPDATVAVGESGRNLDGWRLTHRQASIALPIAKRRSRHLVRYADVALIASALQDEVLPASLRQIYLEPLEVERDRGKLLFDTLRAYLRADQSISSAASLLGVDRHTVSSRLRIAEELLGRTLGSCMADLETALEMADLDRAS